jgi:hypothetical protein
LNTRTRGRPVTARATRRAGAQPDGRPPGGVGVGTGKTGGAARGPDWTRADSEAVAVAFVQLLARAAGTEAQLVPVPRARIEAQGGGIMHPPHYFGVYLDIPAITADPGRVTADLGLTLTPLEEGMRATFAWHREQPRAPRDYTWEDALLRGGLGTPPAFSFPVLG